MGGPLTKIRLEDQLRGDSLQIGGPNGTTFGTLIVHESSVGANDAQSTVEGNMLIKGDLEVLGSQTILDTTVFDVADINITINKGGTDLTSHGAGLTVERQTSPYPSFVWNTARQAWSAGIVGSEEQLTSYIHDQAVASSNWVISHGMGKFPAVSVVDSADNVVIGDVIYVDTNNIAINFNSATTGRAYLN